MAIYNIRVYLDRQPPPPSRPPFNPPVDQRPMRPPPTNYPLHRPNNMDPPPIQPRDNPPGKFVMSLAFVLKLNIFG